MIQMLRFHWDVDIAFVQKIDVLGVCIEGKLITINMSIAFVQKLVPKYLLYNA